MTIAIACIAANAALVFLLGFWVSIQRSVGDKVIYHGETLSPESALAKAIRAHGNASEYAGVIIGVILATIMIVTMKEDGVWPVWITSAIIAVTAARWLHAIGCLTCETLAKPHPLKAIGAIVTYIGGAALAIGLVV